MAFKMKGSPMQRNFGIGSPMKKEPTPHDGKKLPAHVPDEMKPIEGFHHVPNPGWYDEKGQYGEKHKKAKTLKTK